MKSITKAAAILLSVFLIFAFRDIQQSDFSGSWKRNSEKTDAGILSINSVPVQLEIVQTNKEIKITRTSKDRFDSTFVYTEIINVDGSKSISEPKVGLKISSFHVIPDSVGFVEIADFTDDHGKSVQKVKETWSLENNGKTIKIVAEVETNGENYTLLEIFDK